MKTLVNVFVPAVSESFDILIPHDLRIRSVVTLIAESVESLTNHRYVSSGEETLCSKDKNILLRSNATLEKYGIQNGDHLVLM